LRYASAHIADIDRNLFRKRDSFATPWKVRAEIQHARQIGTSRYEIASVAK